MSGAFLEIGRYGAGDARVLGAALDALAGIGWVARRSGAADRVEVVRRTARLLAEGASAQSLGEEDDDQTRRRLDAIERGAPLRLDDPAITGLDATD